MPNVYELRTLINIPVTFTDLNGVAVDPTTVTFYLQHPDGTDQFFTTLTGVTRTGVGKYLYQFITDTSGRYVYKWEGDGTAQVSSADTTFFVNASELIDG